MLNLARSSLLWLEFGRLYDFRLRRQTPSPRGLGPPRTKELVESFVSLKSCRVLLSTQAIRNLGDDEPKKLALAHSNYRDRIPDRGRKLHEKPQVAEEVGYDEVGQGIIRVRTALPFFRCLMLPMLTDTR